MVRQAGVLVTSDKSVVHGLLTRALSLKAWQGHELPLLYEKVSSILAR